MNAINAFVQPAATAPELASLREPSHTDHAYSTYHRRLLDALNKVQGKHIELNGWVNLAHSQRPVLVVDYDEEADPTPVFTLKGERQSLQANDYMILAGLQVGTGRVRIMVASRERQFTAICYVTDLVYCFRPDGMSAFELLMEAVNNLS